MKAESETTPTPEEVEAVLNKVGNLLTEREMEVLAWIATNARLA